MSLIQVQTEMCHRDGICAATCPMRIIELKTKDSYPTMIEGGDALCIQCGHCVAVCPHQAMDHTSMRADQCPPISKDLIASPQQAEHFLRMRRSIRNYKKKPVPRNQLTKLIEVARYAPSGHNTQPVEWLVVYDSDHLHDLAGKVIDWMRHLIKESSALVQMFHVDRIIQAWEAGVDPIFRGAPHLIVAHAPQEQRTAPTSSTIALAYLELMAPSLDLGACWAGYFMAACALFPPALEALQLAQGHTVFGSVMVGYPKFRYHRLPLRKAPKIDWR